MSDLVGIYRELWTNLSTSAANLSVLTNTTLNPKWPNNPAAAFTKIFTNFEAEQNTGMNNYGQRMRAFVVPPTNGNYTFWISSDDYSDLFLSTNESPTNASLIAQVVGYNNPREWTKYPAQQSAPIALQGGRRYYLEAIMQQGTGGDNLAVRWQLPDGTLEEPMNVASPAGTLLIPCNGVDTPPQIYSQTGNVTAVERSSFCFCPVLMANESPETYQWRLGGINIANAKNPIFAITNASIATNNGQVYTCVISNSAGVITNTPITLNILPGHHHRAPTVVGIQNIGSNNVAITFSEPLAKTTATTVANYVFTNGLVVNGATQDASGTVITLLTGSLTYGSNYSLVINGVQDLASIPNTIAANTTVSALSRDRTRCRILAARNDRFHGHVCNQWCQCNGSGEMILAVPPINSISNINCAAAISM